MKESGLIDNMLQDLLQYERQLNRLGLLIVANQLKAKNDEVRHSSSPSATRSAWSRCSAS